jgi:hypothetical protein
MRRSLFSFRCDAQSRLEWESVVVLVSLGRWLTDGRSAIALALAEEPDRAGCDLVAGPVLAVVPGPDARVLAAIAGVAAQLAFDKDLLTFLQGLVQGLGEVALAGDPKPGGQLSVLTVERLLPPDYCGWSRDLAG